MNDKKVSEKKTCFIITPIGVQSSDIRRKTDGLIESVIKPVLLDANIDIIVPHEMSAPGPIGNAIINCILSCDLCIANLTGLNPNVMYEIAVRHAVNKPIVYVAENGTVLPFDLVTERVIFYSNDMPGTVELRKILPDHIDNAIKPGTIQLNPITNVRKEFVIEEVKTTYGEVVVNKLDALMIRVQDVVNHFTVKNTYRKIRENNSTTYYICTEDEAKMYNLEERGYTKIVVNTRHLDGGMINS